MKKTFVGILVFTLVCVILAALPFNASAAVYSGSCGVNENGDSVTWSVDTVTGTLTISGKGAMRDYSSNMEITNPISGAPWQALEPRSVVVEAGVTRIGVAAFAACEKLETVLLPNSLAGIGDGAFYLCSGLTDIRIPDSVCEIGDATFAYCENLTEITLPKNLTILESGLFAYCTRLNDVRLPDNLKIIGDSVFTFCENLSTLQIPDGVTLIQSYAFGKCTGLQMVDIPDSVVALGDSAFEGCISLTDVHIPEGLQEIRNGLFYGCSSLSEIELPESVFMLGAYAFHDTAWFENQANGFVYLDDFLYAYKGDFEDITEVTIPEGTCGIAGRMFEGWFNLETIVISDSVQSVGRNAFHATAWYGAQPTGPVYAGKFLYAYKDKETEILTDITVPAGLETVFLQNGTTCKPLRCRTGCAGLETVHLLTVLTCCILQFRIV